MPSKPNYNPFAARAAQVQTDKELERRMKQQALKKSAIDATNKQKSQAEASWKELTGADKGNVLRFSSKAAFLADPEGTMRAVQSKQKPVDLSKNYLVGKDAAINLHRDLGWSLPYLKYHEPDVAVRRSEWYVKRGWAVKDEKTGRITPKNDDWAGKIKEDIAAYEARDKARSTSNASSGGKSSATKIANAMKDPATRKKINSARKNGWTDDEIAASL
jgi:hypothetical protein